MQILNWFKVLDSKNRETNVFNSQELQKIIFITRRKIIHEIYFSDSYIGVDKVMRKSIFFKMNISDICYVVSTKIREKIKNFIHSVFF